MPGTDPELDAYIGMSLRRRHDDAPDVDAEWRKLRSTMHAKPQRKGGGAVMRYILSAVAGAAAMLAFMLIIGKGGFSGSDTDRQPLADNTVKAASDSLNTARGVHTSASANLADSLNQNKAEAPVVIAHANGTSGQRQRLTTPSGMDLKVTLPDGSEAWLNAGSTMEFLSSTQARERRVKLSGEAYFKVAHNPKRPFIVETEQMSVRVLGTEFNLKSYSAEPACVTLVNGKVEVIQPGTSATAATLKPGEEAWYDANGEIRVADADVYAVTQWVKGYFYFRDKPLVSVLRELGRWYNLGVVFHNHKALDYKVHFSSMRNADINDVIDNLNKLQSITLRVEDGNLVVY